MKLEDAIKAFEIGKTKDDALDIACSSFEIYSGGVRVKDAQIPALYVKMEDAVIEWFRTLNQIAMGHDGAAYRWLEPPKLAQYQITMQDKAGTHRVVSDRYTVASKIAFGA